MTRLVKEKSGEVAESPGLLSEALHEVAEFVETDGAPFLLILDDFEQVLQPTPPTEGLHGVDARFIDPVSEVLRCFQAHGGDSRLIITCRYEFQLPNAQGALVDSLKKVQLFPFTDLDHQRQLAQLQQTLLAGAELDSDQMALLTQALRLASGNPGLLRHLVDLVVTEPAAAPELWAQLDAYIREGNDPADSAVGDYLKGLAIGAKLDALDETEQRVLEMATLVSLPVPRDLFSAIADEFSPGSGDEACRRLLSFGLLDRTPDPVDPNRIACSLNQLASPRIKAPGEDDENFFAQRLLPLLSEAWPHDSCPASCDVQLCQLAGITREAGTFTRRAETALAYLADQSMYGLGYPLAKLAAELVEHPSARCSRRMATLIGSSAQSQHDRQQARDLYSDALAALPEPTTAESAIDYGGLLLDQARLMQTLGDIDVAESSLGALAELFARFDLTRERAVTLGDIARIKVSRDEVDAALQLQNERLDTHRALGDQDGIAGAQNDRFDILVEKELWEDALKAIAESFQIFMQIRRMDGLGVVGIKYGRFLATAGQTGPARQVLEVAKQAWEKLGRQGQIERVDQLLAQLPPDESDEGGDTSQ